MSKRHTDQAAKETPQSTKKGQRQVQKVRIATKKGKYAPEQLIGLVFTKELLLLATEKNRDLTAQHGRF